MLLLYNRLTRNHPLPFACEFDNTMDAILEPAFAFYLMGAIFKPQFVH
jgi:hypothetical protein